MERAQAGQVGQVGTVHERLLGWYALHARDLPWRTTRDPYAVLVSEVMLQQTQVERVLPRWHAWLDQFPTLRALAAASVADAIRAWQGLGYNMRAVRLHRIACQVVAEYGGELPRTVDGLLKLNGVGRYTAGAVACFAYEQPVSMVDTNVRRVLGRVFGAPSASAAEAQALADEVLPRGDAYRWNQALMDLGATLCRAQAPLCLVCPLLGVCASAGQAVRQAPRSQGTFAGSSRFIRGRILDALRTLPVGSSLSHAELAARVPGVAQERLDDLVGRLIADGLVARGDGARVHLPI